LACPTANDCIAASQGGLLDSTNGGATWQLAQSTGIVGATLGDITCTTATCFAAGYDNGGGVVYSSTSPATLLPTVTSVSPSGGPISGGTPVTISGTNFSTTPGSTSIDFGSQGATAVSCSTTTSCVATSPAGSAGTVPISVTTSAGASLAGSSGAFTYATPAAPPAPVNGYWLVGSDGGIFTFGSATFFGSTGSLKLQRPVVGITPTTDKSGYWLDASDGGVFAFGDATFHGSIPGLGLAPAGTVGGKHLNAPIVGMVPSASGHGYFMVGSDGGVFAFGDATYEGSCPALTGGCAGTAVGVAPDASGNGYWLVTSSGHVYAFGDAVSFGGPGPQSSAITSIVRTPDGGGYWILDANGSVFTYGDAAYLGGLPSGQAGGFDPASSIFATSSGTGYWIVTALGRVSAFGTAPADGDMSSTRLNGSIIAATGF
jgi:IPT/TIG domain-containing protein